MSINNPLSSIFKVIEKPKQKETIKDNISISSLQNQSNMEIFSSEKPDKPKSPFNPPDGEFLTDQELKQIKSLDLKDMHFEQIQGGITREALCMNNEDMQYIFDIIDTEEPKGVLSLSEIKAFQSTIEELSKDDILKKSEAGKFRDSQGKKVDYKKVFRFLVALNSYTNSDIKNTYIKEIDGKPFEITEFKDGTVEEKSPDGSYKSITSQKGDNKIETKIYENNILTKTITKDGNKTTEKDVLKNIVTETIDMGDGTYDITITETNGSYNKITHIAPDKTVTSVETEYSRDLRKVTNTDKDGVKTYTYGGYLRVDNHHVISPEHLEEYLKGESDVLEYLGTNAISMVTNSILDDDTKKRYITGLVTKLLDYASSFTDISSKELEEALEKYKSGELEDTSEIERLYNKMYVEVGKALSYDMNGKVDKDFSQGDTGDCWLLASIKSLTLNPKTSKILDDCIKIESNGNVKVTLKGVHKTFTITQAELDKYDYAEGDRDVKAIEIAVEKYMRTFGDPMEHEDFTLDGGFASWGYFILTGIRPKQYTSPLNADKLSVLKQPDTLACASISSESDRQYQVRDKNGEEITLDSHHSYTVKSMDSENVYLINPWDTSETLAVSIKDFQKYFTNLTFIKV